MPLPNAFLWSRRYRVKPTSYCQYTTKRVSGSTPLQSRLMIGRLRLVEFLTTTKSVTTPVEIVSHLILTYSVRIARVRFNIM